MRALDLVRELRASRMGVDRDGELWAWDQRGSRVVLYSAAGAAIASAATEGALAIDADGAWGVAEVTRSGFEVRVRPWIGSPETGIPLSDQASAVAWIAPHTVALGMATAAHRVEIWNTLDRSMTKTFGTEKPVVRKPGLSRRRSYELRYAAGGQLLFTLESFTGDLQIFSSDGRLVRREQVPAVEGRASIEAWLQQLDQKGRQAGEVKDPAITWYWLDLDRSGNAWIVSGCDRKQGKATLFEVPAAGVTREVVVDESCCSRAFAIWGDQAIFYRDPGDPLQTCNGLRRLP